MTAEEFTLWRNLAMIPFIVAVLGYLFVVLCREWVKNDLRDRLCQPLSVRWRFFVSPRIVCSFHVRYADMNGHIHRAACWTYWHRRDVTWEADQIIQYQQNATP